MATMFKLGDDNTIEIADGCPVGLVNSHVWSCGFGIDWRGVAPYVAPSGWQAYRLEALNPKKHKPAR